MPEIEADLYAGAKTDYLAAVGVGTVKGDERRRAELTQDLFVNLHKAD
jgi:hypothetical protein